MMVWLCEWGVVVGLIGIIIFFVCAFIAFIAKFSCNNNTPFVITVIGLILSSLLMVSGVVAVDLDKDVLTEDYKENAVIVETYTTSKWVRIGKKVVNRTQYHVILESPKLKEEHEFLVKADSFDKIEDGAKVLLITKKYTTKYTKKQEFDYDWEFGEIK